MPGIQPARPFGVRRTLSRWMLASLPFLGSVLWPVTAWSAEDTEEADSQTDLLAELMTEADGIPIGSMLLTPGLAVGMEYDTNIFATRTDEIDDTVVVYRPSLGLASDWQRHELEFNAGAAVYQYDSYDSENVEDYWADLSGELDYSKRGYLFGGLAYSRDHEDRGSLEASRFGSSPTQYDSTRGHLGLSQAFGRWTLRAGGTAESLSFEDSPPISNADRDRDMFGAGVRLSYRLSSRFAFYGEGIWDRRDYDQPVDDFGFARSSDGYRAGIGVQTRLTNQFHADAFLGYMEQNYDDVRFDTLRKPDFNARIRFLPGPLSVMTGRIVRSLEESTVPLSSGYLTTTYSLAGSHRFSPRLSSGLSMGFTDVDYVGLDRTDEFWSANASADYRLTRNLHVQAAYRYVARDSSEELEVGNPANRQFVDDYAREWFSLSLAADLYPVRESTGLFARGVAESGHPWDLYAGLAGAHQILALDSAGSRDVAGIDEAERAGMDSSSAAFGGLSVRFGGWRVGLEVDGDRGGASVYEQKTKDEARTLIFDANSSSGISLLLGRRIGDAGWLIGGGGLTETAFDVYYRINEAPENADTGSDKEKGVRWLLGTEADVGKRLFVRLDHTITNYDAMTLDLTTETESFDPSLMLSRLGLGVRLRGRSAPAVPPPEPDRHWVLFGGAQVGHSAILSDLSGTHTDGAHGGAPERAAFDGEFGGQDGVLSGVFMGGDLVFRRLHLGVEGEYAASHLGWDHVRSPTGRTFSVALKEETAYSARIGFRLAAGSLIYARYGQARARFVTTWVKGGNRDNDIERDDRKQGRRWGVGMELPFGTHGLLRSEYTLTRYDDYAFTTSHDNVDAMTFDNDVATFRMGLGIRF